MGKPVNKFVAKKQKTHRIAQDGQTRPKCCDITNLDEMPSLRRLFELLAGNEVVNFLDFMGAVSEMVAFYTKCDSDSEALEIEKILRSQNKCRFCP